MTNVSVPEMVGSVRSVGGFHGVQAYSEVFSLALGWTTLEKVPGVGVVRRWLYLHAKALGVGPAVVVNCGRLFFLKHGGVQQGAKVWENARKW
jgi:hypothetical protein